jgi:hypothetical protein
MLILFLPNGDVELMYKNDVLFYFYQRWYRIEFKDLKV